MAHTEEEIASTVMSKLYQYVSLAAGNEDEGTQDDPFICWCKPGIPFLAEDFEFAQFRVNGQGTTEDERMNNLVKQKIQAAGFSKFADFIPSVNGVVEGKVEGGILRPGSAGLSTIYKRILESSQVVELPQSEEVSKKISALQAQAAPLQENYQKLSDEYDIARANFGMKRIESSYSPAARLKFEAEGPGLKKKMIQAKDNWEISGNKTKYENITAEIQSLRGLRSPAIWRKEAIDLLETMAIEDPQLGTIFPIYPYPGSFAQNIAGWTKISVSTSHIDKLSQVKNSKYSVGGKIGWGSFKLGGDASRSTSSELTVSNTENFGISLKITQVSLMRPWFDPWFFKSSFWRINPASMEAQEGKIVSDGGGDNGVNPPKGDLIAYPVTAIFVSDINITMDEFKDENSDFVKKFNISGGGGWGLGAISASGSKDSSDQTKKSVIDTTKGEMTIPGMQLVGYLCEMMGKSPNPKTGLKWVGGD